MKCLRQNSHLTHVVEVVVIFEVVVGVVCVDVVVAVFTWSGGSENEQTFALSSRQTKKFFFFDFLISVYPEANCVTVAILHCETSLR